jgi:hypothetical protein
MFACDKEQKENLFVTCPEGPSWTGDWKLSAYWASPGAGPVSWSPATEEVSVNFTTDNIFSSTKDNKNRYIIKSGLSETILTLYRQGSTDSSYFALKFYGDTLILNNLGCIEGCGEKYVRPATGHVQQ